ncbi:hypothetical protein J3B01_004737 [Coemansia erecta]|nr:hypothetical protein J3B01_004737 [Coemansia erecta]
MLTELNGFMRQPYKRLLRDQELWSMVRQAGPALKRLALDFELKITETGLHALLHFGCVNIRHLDIRANGNICTSTINAIIAQAGLHLETVVLVAVGVGNAVVKQLLLHAPGLKNLDLSYSLDLTFDAFPPIDGTEHDQQITYDDATKWESDIVWDSDSLGLVRHPGNPNGQIALPKLEELQLRQCCEIDDTAVSRIVSIFGGSLRSLDVRKTHVSIQGLQEILCSARQCGFKAVEPVQSNLPGNKPTCATLALQQLKMQNVDFISNANVFDVGMARNPDLAPWTVPEFTRMTPHLTSIHIGGHNSYITDYFVDQLAQGLRGLLRINILECELLSDRALASLAIFCPKLEAADISKCSRFSDMGVVELVQSCRGLKYLDISRLAVTDNSLTVIGNTQRELEVLLMSGCPRITSAGVMAVMEGSDGLGCQFTLRRLAFNDCANVDKDTYEWCKRRLNPDAQLAQV